MEISSTSDAPRLLELLAWLMMNAVVWNSLRAMGKERKIEEAQRKSVGVKEFRKLEVREKVSHMMFTPHPPKEQQRGHLD
jgi:hypothetical protein